MAVIDYKCLNCNAKLEFKADRQLWHCDYCQSEYTLGQLEAAYADRDEEEAQAHGHQHSHDHGHIHEEKVRTGSGELLDETQIQEWHCDNCGAEIIGDVTTVATHCAYCGNTAIMPKQLEGTYRPDVVIPFAVTKEQAEQALVNRVKSLKYVPPFFIEKKQTEKLMGVYVATWLYDTEVHAQARFSAENVSKSRSGDYETTTRKIYQLEREADFTFTRVPVDGSQKMDDTLMEAIEPFDYDRLEPFKLPYLSGFFADRYDEDAESRRERALERVKATAIKLLRESVTGYNNVQIQDEDYRVRQTKIVQALLPVWLMSVTWEGKNFLFAVNGQTRKFVGDLPLDKSLQMKTVLKGVAVGAILALIGAFVFRYFM